MRRLPVLALSLIALLALSACASSSGGTAAPAGSAPASAPAASAPASAPAASAPASAPAAGGGGCTTSGETGGVSVGIANFAFEPADVTAAVGQTITWTNSDSAAHTATLDNNACDTGSIAKDASAGLVFDAPGTYAYHCKIHPNMTGTITIQ
jgi:plastocyanin